MASFRAKNTASEKDIAKVLRGVGITALPDEKDYMVLLAAGSTENPCCMQRSVRETPGSCFRTGTNSNQHAGGTSTARTRVSSGRARALGLEACCLSLAFRHLPDRVERDLPTLRLFFAEDSSELQLWVLVLSLSFLGAES